MRIIKDSGFWVLLAANVSLLIRYFFYGLPIESLMMAYWIQSVIIGFFNTARILLFPTKNITASSDTYLIKKSRRNFIGVFFFFHFMAFHLAYLLLLLVTLGSPKMFGLR